MWICFFLKQFPPQFIWFYLKFHFHQCDHSSTGNQPVFVGPDAPAQGSEGSQEVTVALCSCHQWILSQNPRISPSQISRWCQDRGWAAAWGFLAPQRFLWHLILGTSSPRVGKGGTKNEHWWSLRSTRGGSGAGGFQSRDDSQGLRACHAVGGSASFQNIPLQGGRAQPPAGFWGEHHGCLCLGAPTWDPPRQSHLMVKPQNHRIVWI